MSKKINAKILVVDDDVDILLTAKIVLKQQFTEIFTENNPHNLTALLAENTYDLVLLDMNFTAGFTSGKEGLRWLKKIRKTVPSTHVVLMTAYGDINLAVRGMKEGATDFVVKPWDNEALQATVLSAIQEEPPLPVATPLAQEQTPIPVSHEIIGRSAAMQKVFRTIEKVAATDANILLLGENGTGKELIARAIHRQSLRAEKPFVHVDLGAIAETLFESELFGHVKGAFTDARQDREGRFEAAHSGTLFLDEIGNLSLPLQAKLLTALQSRHITRVGANRAVNTDVRLICATNMPLYEMVEQKKFRQDLIYRINTVEITLPPLRERVEDIPLLVNHYLHLFAAKYRREAPEIRPEFIRKLQQHSWPGNIRELQHALERAIIMEDLESILPEEISPNPYSGAENPPEEDYNLEEVEKSAIKHAISKHNGNISKAAKELGLGRTTLYRKMTKYGF
ncbi:MAG: sigma-54 dependent transcriptional regulator [Bacteroidia bacterium]|nr:sigma-54 dependent transcriptional regulator [Bacteroidia bacterium]